MAEKAGPTDFSFVQNELHALDKFRTIKEPPQIANTPENWRTPFLSKFKIWQPIPRAANAEEAVKLKLPPYYTKTVFPKALNVSPLIRLGRWSALVIGVVYGWRRFNRLKEEEGVIRQHNFSLKCRRNRAELEEAWLKDKAAMIDLASQFNMPVPPDFNEKMMLTKMSKLKKLKANLEAWSKDLDCQLPDDFTDLLSPGYEVKPTDKQIHSMPSYKKGNFMPV